jgi:hypothetical protein
MGIFYSALDERLQDGLHINNDNPGSQEEKIIGQRKLQLLVYEGFAWQF